MTIFVRRILPTAAIIAVTAMLSVWISAGASSPAAPARVLPPLHLRTVQTSQHFSPNGATQKKPAGGAYQATGKLVSAGKQIGTFFVTGTIVTNSGVSLQNIEARFPGKGRLELQGTAPPSGGGTQVITGGSGMFAHAAGKAISHKGIVTVTFR